jgi:formiminotetrahydrofolate cyclodeaminase
MEGASAAEDQPAYLGLSVADFLDLVSEAQPSPAGGSVAALAVALAGGLCVMAARLSVTQLPDAADLAAAAGTLRDRAASLIEEDAAAYGRVVSAQRLPREPESPERRRLIGAALAAAAEVPTELAEIGADLADLAARIAEGGNPNLLGDAVTAALLADAGVRSAAALVTINLKDQPGDDRRERVARAMAGSAASAARARRKLGA